MFSLPPTAAPRTSTPFVADYDASLRAGYDSPDSDDSFRTPQQPPGISEFYDGAFDGTGPSRDSPTNWYAQAANSEFLNQPEISFQGYPSTRQSSATDDVDAFAEDPLLRQSTQSTILGGLMPPPDVLDAGASPYPSSGVPSSHAGASPYPSSGVFFNHVFGGVFDHGSSTPSSPSQVPSSRKDLIDAYPRDSAVYANPTRLDAVEENLFPPRTSSFFEHLTGGLLSDGTGSEAAEPQGQSMGSDRFGKSAPGISDSMVTHTGWTGQSMGSDRFGKNAPVITDSMVTHAGWSDFSAFPGAAVSYDSAPNSARNAQAKLHMRELLRPAELTLASIRGAQASAAAEISSMGSGGMSFREDPGSGMSMPSYAYHAATFADILNGSTPTINLPSTAAQSHPNGSPVSAAASPTVPLSSHAFDLAMATTLVQPAQSLEAPAFPPASISRSPLQPARSVEAPAFLPAAVRSGARSGSQSPPISIASTAPMSLSEASRIRNQLQERAAAIATVVEPAEDQVQTLIWEVVEEVPTIQKVQMQEERPVVQYQDVPKAVPKPVIETVQKVVEVPVPWKKETLVEVPQIQYVDIVREVPKPKVQIVQKPVSKPVIEIVEREVPVPQVTMKEQILEVPCPETVEVYKEVLVEEKEEIEKKVVIPELRLEERLVEVEHIETHDRIVEMPEVEIHEIIKQVPKTEIVYVDREVQIPQIQYVEKLVEVPQVVYIEQPVEVPKIVKREVIKHVPKPVIQYIDRPVPKHIMNYREVIEDVPVMLKEERVVEVPEIHHVETTTKVPKYEIKPVPKEVTRWKIEPEEVLQEVPAVIRQERAKEVPRILSTELVRETVTPVTNIVDKQVPKVDIRIVEQVIEIPQVLRRETPVQVPVVQVAEALRQVPEEVAQRVAAESSTQVADYARLPMRAGDAGSLRYRTGLSLSAPSAPISVPSAVSVSSATQPATAQVVYTASEVHSPRARRVSTPPLTSSAVSAPSMTSAVLTQSAYAGAPGSVSLGASVGTFSEGLRSERIVGDSSNGLGDAWS